MCVTLVRSFVPPREHGWLVDDTEPRVDPIDCASNDFRLPFSSSSFFLFLILSFFILVVVFVLV